MKKRLLGTKNVQLTKGLISVWELEETSGTTVNDSHNSNDGTNVGPATVNQTCSLTNLDKCYSFYEDHILLTNKDVFDAGNEFSFSTWVKFSTLNTRAFMLGKGLSTWASPYYQVYVYLYRPNVDYEKIIATVTQNGAGGTLVSSVKDLTGTVAVDTWYHIAVTCSLVSGDYRITLFVDGEKQTEAVSTLTGVYTNYNTNYALGKFLTWPSYASNIDGYLAQTAMWDRMLTASEVAALYNSGDALDYSNW